MLQSSITAWLKKPTSVLKAPNDSPKPVPPASILPSTNTKLEESTEVKDAASGPPQTSASTAPVPRKLNLPTLPPLPPNVEFVALTPDLVPAWKRLNALSFPISYHASFYTETLENPVIHSLTLMALWHSVPPPTRQTQSPGSESKSKVEEPKLIGAVRCRILADSTLYLSTISVLAAYRSYGIATHLLHRVILDAVEQYGIKTVTAHVWEMNEEGLAWYDKRGFEVIGKEPGYYHKLRPGTAVLVRKVVGVRDLLGADT